MTNNLSEVKNKLALAKEWTVEAGQYIRDNMNYELEIDEKTNHTDLVTNMDKSVQDKLVSYIKGKFPGDNILAEENNLRHSVEKGNVWVIDPIDGTSNFVSQKDNFAVMVAYFENGVGKFGIILDVMKENLYWGDGKKVFRNNDELQKPKLNLKHSVIGVNSYMYRTNDHGLLDYSENTLGVRILGSAGIEYTKLIEGKISGYFSNLSPWDYAAGTIILSAFDYVTEAILGGNPKYDGREKVFTVEKSNIALVREFIN
ncbi:inositol monophosphatase family protein [Floricoccus penangensis]|uniref:inositol monophosphatase family protein n=1 Tax=Floricoccus penangensis TaxID=1859475 RepID=UPI00203A8DAD|nr:inositol monophosphatase family protein [Floricoccus penangensis]